MGEFADKLAAKPLSFQRAYLGSLLPNHVKSGNLEKYYQKLTDFNFLMAKIQHPEFGVQALIDDFNLVDDSEAVTHPEYNPEKAKALDLIQSVLWMSGDILDGDETQLAVQFLGRLVHFNIPAIQAMLEVAKQRKAAPWLRPLTPCFTSPRRGLLRTLEGHRGEVNAVAVTADGKRAISGSMGGTLKVWNLTTGKEEFTLEGHSHPECRNCPLAVTADGKRAIASGDKTLKVWDLTTRKELFTLKGHSEWVTAVAVTADGKRAISGSYDHTLKVWNLTTGKEEFTLEGHSNSVKAVAVTADGKRAISCWNHTLKVWDLTTRKEQFTLEGHSEWVTAVAVTADGKRAISASSDNTLKVWNLTTGKEEFTLKGHRFSVTAVAVTADGKRAISGSWDSTIKVWDLTTRKEQFTLNKAESVLLLKYQMSELLTGEILVVVNAVAVTADGKRAVSGSHDRTVKVWDLTTRKEEFTLKNHRDLVNAVAITADGKRAISGSDDQTLKVWDLTTGKEEFTLKVYSGEVKAVAITADGKRAISGSYDPRYRVGWEQYSRENRIQVWDLTTKKKLFTVHASRSSVQPVAVTADGKMAIFASIYSPLIVWDLTTRKHYTLKGHSHLVNAVAVTADGKRAISASRDSTLKVWDLTTKKELFTLKGHSDSVYSVAVTADGKRAISGSSDNTLKVWDLTTGKEEFTLKEPGDRVGVIAVAVTADGKLAVTFRREKKESHSSLKWYNNTLKVWDLSSGNVIASFAGESSIACCAIAPDGVTIVAGDESGRVYFLRLEGIAEYLEQGMA